MSSIAGMLRHVVMTPRHAKYASLFKTVPIILLAMKKMDTCCIIRFTKKNVPLNLLLVSSSLRECWKSGLPEGPIGCPKNVTFSSKNVPPVLNS